MSRSRLRSSAETSLVLASRRRGQDEDQEAEQRLPWPSSGSSWGCEDPQRPLTSEARDTGQRIREARQSGGGEGAHGSLGISLSRLSCSFTLMAMPRKPQTEGYLDIYVTRVMRKEII